MIDKVRALVCNECESTWTYETEDSFQKHAQSTGEKVCEAQTCKVAAAHSADDHAGAGQGLAGIEARDSAA